SDRYAAVTCTPRMKKAQSANPTNNPDNASALFADINNKYPDETSCPPTAANSSRTDTPDSRTTCAFVPLNPNALTAPRRTPPPLSHDRNSRFTKNGLCSQST